MAAVGKLKFVIEKYIMGTILFILCYLYSWGNLWSICFDVCIKIQ